MIATIPLSRGAVAVVDASDAALVDAYRWTVRPPGAKSTRWYAFTTLGGRTVYMHRLILGARSGQEVDHVNGDGLDNRRANLRLATRAQNEANKPKPAGRYSSRFKGVYWDSAGRCWRTCLMVAKRTRYLGRFPDELSAARAYDAAARQQWGAFARVNFPEPAR